MSPLIYHILLALGEGTMHGYGIIQAFEEMTDGEATLLPGSLYGALGRMVESEMLEEAEVPADERSGGPQRRYYRATPYGQAVARAESARLERLLAVARDRALAPEAGR